MADDGKNKKRTVIQAQSRQFPGAGRRKPGVVFAVSLLVGITIVVSLLFILKERIRRETEDLPNQIASQLRPELIGSPTQIRSLDALEQFAVRIREDFPSVEQIYISKLRADNLERCIFPWPHDFIPKDRLQSFKVEQNGVLYGYLYLGLDTRRERILEAAIGLLIPVLILAAAALGFHVWRQEKGLLTARGELVERDRQLARMERLSLAGQLAANLLHDLKKPILHIRDEVRQKAHTLDQEALLEQADLFFQMLRETNLEKLASAKEDRQEYLDIGQVLEVSLNLVKYERGRIEVVSEVEEELPFLFANKYRLIQVFSNILLNAFQVLEGRGRVEVRAVRGAPDSADQGTVIVEIRDDGPGIAPENLKKVFEPFYSASGRPDASGLGLYISRTIVEGLGGAIEMVSEQGKGTIVRVILPAEEG